MATKRTYKNFDEFKKQFFSEHPEMKPGFELLVARYEAIERLRQLRAKHGLSQAQLAERMGVQQNVVSRLESATHSPRLETLAAAGAAMGYDVHVKWTKRRKRVAA